MGWPEGWPIRRMEVHLRRGQKRLGRLHQAVEVIPPAMAGQVLLQVAPQPLDQIELRRIGRQEERLESFGQALPVDAQLMALVVADVVEHEHRWFICRERVGQVVEEGREARFPFCARSFATSPVRWHSPRPHTP